MILTGWNNRKNRGGNPIFIQPELAYLVRHAIRTKHIILRFTEPKRRSGHGCFHRL
jgi:hypothetical protein